jgi:hypothetical protein
MDNTEHLQIIYTLGSYFYQFLDKCFLQFYIGFRKKTRKCLEIKREECLVPMKLTQRGLSDGINVPYQRVNELINGKRELLQAQHYV